jgi:hypothetical protein
MKAKTAKRRIIGDKIAAEKLAITGTCFFFLAQAASSPTLLQAQIDQSEAPRITISSATKAGSYYSDDFTISGQIEGAAIKDAAVYVAGQRLSTLELKTHYRNPKNNKFKITVDASEEPELRIVTDSGVTLIEKIDVLDYRS